MQRGVDCVLQAVVGLCPVSCGRGSVPSWSIPAQRATCDGSGGPAAVTAELNVINWWHCGWGVATFLQYETKILTRQQNCAWCCFNVVYSSVCLSVCFNCHFPGGPGLASTRISSCWILLALRMMEVLVISMCLNSCTRHQTFSSPHDIDPSFAGNDNNSNNRLVLRP